MQRNETPSVSQVNGVLSFGTWRPFGLALKKATDSVDSVDAARRVIELGAQIARLQCKGSQNTSIHVIPKPNPSVPLGRTR